MTFGVQIAPEKQFVINLCDSCKTAHFQLTVSTRWTPRDIKWLFSLCAALILVRNLQPKVGRKVCFLSCGCFERRTESQTGTVCDRAGVLD